MTEEDAGASCHAVAVAVGAAVVHHAEPMTVPVASVLGHVEAKRQQASSLVE